jgi:hypothetical protein
VIRSKVFTISRPQFVRVASVQYLKRMWPIFGAFPAFGLLALIFGPNQFIKVIGFFAILWPFSIPARVVMVSWNKAKRLMQPTWVGLEDGVLYFHDQEGGGTKLPLTQIRRVDKREGFYVFETRMFNFALVPIDSFEEADRVKFEAGLAKGLGT